MHQVFGIVAAASLVSPLCYGAVIVEAESGTLAAGLSVVADATAYGGQAVANTAQNTTAPGNLATYSVAFDMTGTYNLYARIMNDGEVSGSAGAAGNLSDSLFAPTDFGLDPSLVLNNLYTAGTPNTWYWVNLSTWDAAVADDGVTYEVTDASSPLTFILGGREDGLSIDTLVFSTDAQLTGEQLDALVPEPASLALLGLGGLALLRRRS